MKVNLYDFIINNVNEQKAKFLIFDLGGLTTCKQIYDYRIKENSEEIIFTVQDETYRVRI